MQKKKPDASHRRTCCVHTSCFSAALGSIEPLFLLFLLLVFLYQSRTCWKDSRKCQEETAYACAVFLGEDSCRRRNEPAKNKANDILVPFCSFEGRRVDFDLHAYPSHKYHSPNATQSHTGIEQIVAQSAFGLWRIMTQLTREA